MSGRKLCQLLFLCLLVLSIFTSCDQNKGATVITITLDSGILGESAKTLEAVENKNVLLPSGDSLWTTEKYSFSGWATTKGGDVSYKAGAGYASSSNITLYAVWTANPKITYNPNGGTGEAITEYYKSGAKVTIKNTSFTKEGYTLSYWSTSSDGTDTYTIGQDITLTQDLTLYAVWVVNKNPVTITFNSGKIEKDSETIDTVEGNSILLPSGDSLWTTDDYTFSGWSEIADGDVKYKAGEKYTTSSSTTLYAVWLTNPKITYDPNGGTGERIVESYKGGSKVTIKSTSFTNDGYTLSYWSTAANGSEIYTFGQEITLTKDLTLYAVWVENTKSVAITFNPGVIADKAQTISISKGNEIVLPTGDSLWSVSGYNFLGWSESSTGDVEYKAGGKYTASSDYTLYAVWEKKMATLSYNANGGDGIIDSIRVAQGTEVTLADGNAFSRNGFTLSSWVDENGTPYDLNSKLTLNEDITLYAVWTENYNIKYYSYNEGDGKYKLIAIDYPQKNSATIGDGNGLFQQGAELYWTTKPDDTGIPYDVGEIYTGADDLSLYAKWQENDGALEYKFNSATKTYSVKASGTNLSGEIEILGKYKEREVTAIAESAFENCSSLTKVTIPSTITSISNKAFGGCKALSSVTFDNNKNLTTIGSEAFRDCWALTSFDIPNSVTSIGKGAFYGAGIETIEIPTGVTTICENTFYGCYKLKNVYIPNTVESIGSEAFMSCSSLEEISIPSSVSEVASYAFHPYVLKKIYIENIEGADGAPTGVNWGVYSATVYWTGNYNVDDNGVLSVKNESLEKGSIVLPDKVNGKEVTSIGDGAFSKSTELTDISIPSSVKSIGDGAFSDCSSLKSIYIDNIEDSTDAPTGAPWGATNSPTIYWTGNYSVDFYMSSGLTVKDKSLVKGSIVLPDKVNGKGVTSIGYSAFADCSEMTSISIPATVTSIDSYAFQNCTGLREITIQKNVTEIRGNAFEGCKNISVRIQNISLEYYSSWNSAFSGCKLIYLIIDAGIGSIGTQFQGCGNSLKSISIPSSVTEIASDAFSGCEGLTSIYIDKEYDSSLDSDNNGWGAPKTCTIKWKDNKVSYGFAISSVGDIMELGNYQDTAGNNVAITWKALSVDTTNKRALMISEKVLKTLAFNASTAEYANSGIRTYLTGTDDTDFISSYSIDTSKMLSVDVTSSVEKTTVKDDGSGNDKFFLLSKTEAFYSGLFADNKAREATDLRGNESSWWLRSADSYYENCMSYVMVDGDLWVLDSAGTAGLRPAFWYTWE